MAGGDEAHRDGAVRRQARRLQEDVVPLLRSQVGHGQGQELPVEQPELAANVTAQGLAPSIGRALGRAQYRE